MQRLATRPIGRNIDPYISLRASAVLVWRESGRTFDSLLEVSLYRVMHLRDGNRQTVRIAANTMSLSPPNTLSTRLRQESDAMQARGVAFLSGSCRIKTCFAERHNAPDGHAKAEILPL